MRDDDLELRLSALGETPLPPLAPADVVRRRGDRRRRHQQAALAGAGVLLAAALGGAVALASGGEPQDALGYATPVPSATPSTAPSAEPTTEPSPSVAAVGPQQLLDPSRVADLVGGTWTVDAESDVQWAGAFQSGCRSSVPGAEAGLSRSLAAEDGRRLAHEALRYSDAAVAQQVFDQWVAELETCPERLLDSDDGKDVVEALPGLPGEGAARSYSSTTRVPNPERCISCGPSSAVLALSVVGEHLSWVTLVGGSDDDLPDLADAADALVRGDAPTARDVDFTQVLLPPERADAVEGDGWAIDTEYVGLDGPLLDPCGGDTHPGTVLGSVERRLLGEDGEPETGPRSLTQEVLDYGDEAAAARALDQLVDRVEDCPESRPSSDLRVRHEVVDADDGAPATRLVRREGCSVVGDEEPVCPPHLSRSYYLVAQAGSVLTVAHYEWSEDGDLEEQARALLAAVAQQLDGATS